MRILRTSFIVLPLLLSACSFTTTTTSTSSQQLPEQEPSSETTKTEEVVTTEQVDLSTKNLDAKPQVTEELSQDELMSQLQKLDQLAQQNVEELETRLGHSIEKLELPLNSNQARTELQATVNQYESFNTMLTKEIIELDKRVENRRDHPSNGDILQLHLSAINIKKEKSFKAPALVGNWVRGESRVVKLTENFLVENAVSEPLNVTFTESYQIIINGKLIGTFAPTRSKYELEFDAPTADSSGTVSGTLKIRLESE
ncbi:hypothetical protein [Marinomonas ostreistagni]|uniref:Lipoprotein n=1 Tax=Marinomonas ostreistagni TaxID=359209 RepID=A0ABS0Z8P2_9GAMM|nr:hypothetical protein [Marinomonas ostreistagni]MBJ7550019.1 hypothetical protein [Marinomonas ostreistagni]